MTHPTLMLEILAFDFFQRSLIVGSILGVVMAILGVFVVLRRLSFFADAIGHSALTGIAIGLLLRVNPFLAALVFALLVASGIAAIRQRSRLALDTLLGVLFPTAVAIGVILVRLSRSYRADLISFLFGDILTVSVLDIWLSLGLTLVVGGALLLVGKAFISITLNEELAAAEGIAVAWHELLFLLLLAGTIALAIKLVGVILVTALLIIPAASAQNLSRSLVSLFTLSVIIGLSTVVIGMIASALLQLPSGPSIVVIGALFFAVSVVLKPLFTRLT